MEAYERDHLDMLRGYLADCAVLLKSDGAFPLDRPCKLAAYGSGVRRTVKGGTGSGEVNSRFFVTVEQGLTDMDRGAWRAAVHRVLYSTEWLNNSNIDLLEPP